MTESSTEPAEFMLPATSTSPSVAEPTRLHDDSNTDMVADEGTNHEQSNAQESMVAHSSTDNNDSEPSVSPLPSNPATSSSQLEPVLASPVSHSSNVHTMVTRSKAAVLVEVVRQATTFGGK
ncbi:hypothetical protein V6N13_071675 [Hibiscus sabdariffa]|uniref:Uncharacterized protein n=1 Tax=Hibiscus sabdariffa TaxID=183260 RepID=A0ABR2TCU1_9ROSI